ncbi:MAG: ATP-binding cassette domain-containing protein [Desulfurococcaceae archaeon]
MGAVLEVAGLTVSVAGTRLPLPPISFSVGAREAFFILGPNGVGKTSLLRAIVGYPGYEASSGSITFDGEDVTDKPMEYRISKGMGIAHQLPPRLRGIKTAQLLRHLARGSEERVREVAEVLDISHLLNREFGKGFSGGELKRVEIATVLLQRPRLALIDEPDSGVDVDSIKVIGRALDTMLREGEGAMVVVTHSAMISRYLEPSRVCVLLSNSPPLCGDRSLLHEVFEHGFRELA